MKIKSIEGYRYVQSFTGNCSGTMFVYILKTKSDAVQATGIALTDIAPYGEVHSGNSAEFTSWDFQTFLLRLEVAVFAKF